MFGAPEKHSTFPNPTDPQPQQPLIFHVPGDTFLFPIVEGHDSLLKGSLKSIHRDPKRSRFLAELPGNDGLMVIYHGRIRKKNHLKNNFMECFCVFFCFWLPHTSAQNPIDSASLRPFPPGTEHLGMRLVVPWISAIKTDIPSLFGPPPPPQKKKNKGGGWVVVIIEISTLMKVFQFALRIIWPYNGRLNEPAWLKGVLGSSKWCQWLKGSGSLGWMTYPLLMTGMHEVSTQGKSAEGTSGSSPRWRKKDVKKRHDWNLKPQVTTVDGQNVANELLW